MIRLGARFGWGAVDASFYRTHNAAFLGRIGRRVAPVVQFAFAGQWRGLDPCAAFDSRFAADQVREITGRAPRSPWWALTKPTAPSAARMHPMQISEPRGLLPATCRSAAVALARGMEGSAARRLVHPAIGGSHVAMQDASRVYEAIAAARCGTGSLVSLDTDILIVNGDDHCPPCTQYRVLAPAEALRAVGYSVVVVNSSDIHRLAGCDVGARAAVVFRALPDADLLALLEHLRRAGVPLAWDVDDLLFDRNRPLGSLQAAACRSERLDGPQSVTTRSAMADVGRLCAWCLPPTPDLLSAAIAEGIVEGGLVTPSFLTAGQLAIGAEAAARAGERQADDVVIGYSSGTPTHGADFAVAARALSEVMRRRPAVRLRVFGPVDIAGLGLPADRVEHHPGVVHDWEALMERMASVDVVIVPLELDNGYCRAKSEVKYLEAACAGTPTVASATPAYARAIDDPEAGRLVRHPAEWQAILLDVVDDAAWRRSAGLRARSNVASAYGPSGPAARQYVQAIERMMAGATPPPADEWASVLGASGEPLAARGALCLIGEGADSDLCEAVLHRLEHANAEGVAVADFRSDHPVPDVPTWHPGCSWVDLASALRRAGCVEIVGDIPTSALRLVRAARSGGTS